MKSRNLLLFIASALSVVSAAYVKHPKYRLAKQSAKHVIPGRYLVEYNRAHNNDDGDFVAILQSFDATISEPLYHSNSNSVHSVHMNSGDHENFLQTLVDHQDIVTVYPVTYIARPESTYNAYFSQIDPNITQTVQDHHSTQVERIHKELGLSGKDIKVCIIDTGVDYLHPALGGGFGPGYKIAFGADLVGDHFEPHSSNNTLPDPDTPPLDNCTKQSDNANGHGTHVAGIIIGNDTSKGFIGVAPNASLGVWRVFGCNEGTTSEIVMKAMIEAQKAKCDVINMSMGSGGAPWSEEPHAAFAQQLVKQGISVIISNGNTGRNGAFSVTDPAAAHDALSIAAVSNANFLGSLFSVKTSNKTLGPYSYQVAPESDKEIPDASVVIGGNFESLSACKADDISALDLNGKIALVKQGSCMMTEQAKLVAEKGAIGLIYFNTLSREIPRAPYLDTPIPIATISSASGRQLMSVLHDERAVDIHFERNAFAFESATAHTIADFSSIGPTNELHMKPSIAAVGGNVYSTLPRYLGGWGEKSGTSMSSPYIAGVNYGKPLDAYKQKGILDSPLRQGAGLVQAYDALKEPLHVSPAHISFNDTSLDIYKSHTLQITNTGSESVAYSITSQIAASVSPYGHNNTKFELVSYDSDKFYTNTTTATVKLSASTISLQPGESKQITVSVQLPTDFNENEQVMYGGFVQFNPTSGNANASVHVPYFGVLGSLYRLPTLDTSKLNIKDQQGHVYSNKETYHFILSDNTTAPLIDFRLTTPSRQLMIDVIDKQEAHVGYIVASYDYAERSLNAFSIPELNPWKGQLFKDDQINAVPLMIQPGTYQIRWSALRMFGDIKKKDDWMIQTSGPIEITQ
ncbi:hypothetical protein CU098_010713 [Rhizopus stolonifer]|uniref:Peptidase S8/S53 domain-containing protein n=1 Tax=Rhizopus stolonifer TaxID=4846 RepID=A0A367KVV1_RHIST|nr:hypothetical protein CU098_010713 [Rhizopus stolonifer]